RRPGIERVICIDPDRARFDRRGDAVSQPDIARPYGGGQTVHRAVGDLDGPALIAEPDGAHHRTKNLLARNLHGRVDFCEYSRFDEESLRFFSLDIALAAGHQPGALGLAALDVVQHALHLPPGNLRTHLRTRVLTVADAQLGGTRGELADEAVVHL